MKLAKRKKDDPKINYQPKGGKPFHRCSYCSMYEDPHQCSLVAGFIQENGVCDRFAPKQGQPR